MYTRLSKVMTKSYFKKILNESIIEAKEEHNIAPNISLNESIYNQLIDIKKTVVDEGFVYNEEESAHKYPLGVMAVRNYGEYDEWDYPKKLVDISWGISQYPLMKEQ
jgi:hypothetical protein